MNHMYIHNVYIWILRAQVIGFSLFLMDTEAPKESGEHKSAVNAVNINKMDKKGTISLAKFDHILKVL